MADKKISDFSTLADVQSDDLILVSSDDETYNVEAGTFMDSISADVFAKIYVSGTKLYINASSV